MTTKLSAKLYGKKEEATISFTLEVEAPTHAEAFTEIMAGIEAARQYKLSLVPPDCKSLPEDATNPKASPGDDQQANGNQVRASRMTITPRADYKLDVKWYAPNHRYPDFQSVLAPEHLRALLPTEWEIDQLMEAGDYRVRHIITWKASQKLNSKGNPYKNIVSIEDY